MEILVKNGPFGQKWKFWSRMEILAKNTNFGEKSKFWPKIQILAKNPNFGQKSKFWSDIETGKYPLFNYFYLFSTCVCTGFG